MGPEAYHLFEKYLNNDLSEVDKQQFDKRVSDDPEFAETFQIYKEIYAGLAAKENRRAGEMELQKSLENLSDEFFDSQPSERSAKVVSIKRYYLLAAASVTIILGTLFFFNRENSKPLYSQYAEYEMLALAERGDEDSLNVLAEDFFNDGEYEMAVEILQKLTEQDPENRKIKLYLGIALTEIDHFDHAASLLTEIRNSESVFQDKATWYLALNYLKQTKTEACKSVLKEIPESAEEYDKARRLLEELQK